MWFFFVSLMDSARYSHMSLALIIGFTLRAFYSNNAHNTRFLALIFSWYKAFSANCSRLLLEVVFRSIEQVRYTSINNFHQDNVIVVKKGSYPDFSLGHTFLYWTEVVCQSFGLMIRLSFAFDCCLKFSKELSPGVSSNTNCGYNWLHKGGLNGA